MINALTSVFLIMVLGYLLGSVKIAGLNLGTSGVLLVALVFGHFGIIVPAELKDFGLFLFVGAVGFIAGPVFFSNFRQRAFSYIILGLLIILAGVVTTGAAIAITGIPTPLAVGVFAGAMTSTPGLAVAIEATGDALATVGYGIAYPFGVLGVVLFIQLLPRILRADMDAEAAKLVRSRGKAAEEKTLRAKADILLEPTGLLPFAASMALGLALAAVTIPLPGGLSFSLGTSGGPLVTGLLFGHFRRIGKVSIEAPEHLLETMRELGLVLFLMGAGTSAGSGFVEVLREYGIGLFVIGVLITVIPMIAGYLAARWAFGLEMFNCLGSICGGMTSTPALGSLISVAKTNNVAASYAATYPVALLAIVIGTQVLVMIFT